MPPRTWLLLGHKAGDNGQVLALAEALGWPYEVRRMVYRPTEFVTNRLLGTTLAGIDRAASDELAPPWPELVISAGRRNEPVARWIQAQAGGRDCVRLVHIGRPWSPLDRFGLIVTTPQYALPSRANVLHNEAPLHRVTPERLAQAAALWAPRLAHLPRPYTAVLVGGHVGPFTLDRAAARQLGRLVGHHARARGGSLLVSTSARTPGEVIETLEELFSVPHLIYRWRRDDPDNPYFGFLALADSIVVTSDSMSMLIEAIATGKKVRIYDLAQPAEGLRKTRVGALIWRLGRVLGPRRLARNISVIHHQQVQAGRASWLGSGATSPGDPPPLADTQRAAERVRALFPDRTAAEEPFTRS